MKVIKNKKYASFSIMAIVVASTLLYLIPPHMANTSAEEKTGDGSVEADWQWEVNVQESLNMTVTPQDATQSGKTDKFLRTQIGVSVSTNNGSGFTAGMTTKTADTNLVNQSKNSMTLPTLTPSLNPVCANADCEAFPANYWGYSLNDTTNTGTYKALVGVNSAPITVLSNAVNGSKEATVYFGAKANSTKASGTYKGTVIFSVTSETKGADLPASGAAGDPGQPEGPSAEPSTAPSSQPSVVSVADNNTYSYTTGTRTYRSTASSVAEVANTDGNTKKRSTANDFVSPLGVKEESYSVMNIQRGSIVTTILMCVALIAAGIGIFFFILAKRRDEEEEEDEIQQV